jgi:hypothetical protein
MDSEIRAFLAFWDKFGTGELTCFGGVLETAGSRCIHGGDQCNACTKTFDLGGLAETLRTLVGEANGSPTG